MLAAPSNLVNRARSLSRGRKELPKLRVPHGVIDEALSKPFIGEIQLTEHIDIRVAGSHEINLKLSFHPDHLSGHFNLTLHSVNGNITVYCDPKIMGTDMPGLVTNIISDTGTITATLPHWYETTINSRTGTIVADLYPRARDMHKEWSFILLSYWNTTVAVHAHSLGQSLFCLHTKCEEYKKPKPTKKDIKKMEAKKGVAQEQEAHEEETEEGGTLRLLYPLEWIGSIFHEVDVSCIQKDWPVSGPIIPRPSDNRFQWAWVGKNDKDSNVWTTKGHAQIRIYGKGRVIELVGADLEEEEGAKDFETVQERARHAAKKIEDDIRRMPVSHGRDEEDKKKRYPPAQKMAEKTFAPKSKREEEKQKALRLMQERELEEKQGKEQGNE